MSIIKEELYEWFKQVEMEDVDEMLNFKSLIERTNEWIHTELYSIDLKRKCQHGILSTIWHL